MQPFGDRAAQAVQARKSALVAGLDPRLDWIPDEVWEAAGTKRLATPFARKADQLAAARVLLAFNAEVIRLAAPHAVAIKPQIAFYEALGTPGWDIFFETCRLGRAAGLLVIADVKRGDISSTAVAYAEAFLGPGPEDAPNAIDAVTVNPYLGTDSLHPFLQMARRFGKGLFVLVRTSNPSSAEFQALTADGKPIYQHVAGKVAEWGQETIGESGFSSVGAVVGATFPQEGAILRKLLPNAWFLVPGLGAQGGRPEDLAAMRRPDGLGVLANASRGVCFPWFQPPYSERFGAARWRESVAAAAADLQRQLVK